MGTDVFISYPSAKTEIATAICTALEKNEISCWMAPRDILPGITYADALIQAIDSSKIMVLVCCSESNASPHILREVERGVHDKIPIIPVRVDNSDPSNAMLYYISTPHWLNAFEPPFEQHLDRLVKTVRQHLENLSGKPPQPAVTGPPAAPVTVKEHAGSPHVRIAKNTIILFVIAIIVIMGVIAVVILPGLHPSSSGNGNNGAAQQYGADNPSGLQASGSETSGSMINASSPASPATPSSGSASLTGGLPARISYVGVSPLGSGNACGTTATQLISKGSRMCLLGTLDSTSAQSRTIRVMISTLEDCSSTSIPPLAQDTFTIPDAGTSGQSFSHVLNIDTSTLPYAKQLCLKAGIMGSRGSGSPTLFQIS